MNKRKIIIISIAFFIILSISYLIYSIIPRSYIKFSVAPQQVEVAIDNSAKKTIKNKDKITVSPGQHKIIISRNGFESYSKTIVIKNGETNNFLVALNPKTDEAKKIMELDENQAVIQVFYEGIRNKNAKALLEKYPILKILPLGGHTYSITSCKSKKYPNDPTKIALCITITKSNVEKGVLNIIKKNNFNPDDYEIIWTKDYYQGE